MIKIYGTFKTPLIQVVNGEFIIKINGGVELNNEVTSFINDNNEKEIIKYETKNEFYYEKYFQFKPSLEEIKEVIINHYNGLCSDDIIDTFTYDSKKVWLTLENQQNYMRVYTLLSNSNVTVKVGDDYIEFTPTQYKSFINEMNLFIENTLSHYRDIKDNINWDDYII